jgi:hypothetical protein
MSLTLFRKSDDFKARIEKKFADRLEKLSETHKKDILETKTIEDHREDLLNQYEEELKNLELKYDAMMSGVFEKRNKKIQSNSDLYQDFWLRVLTNHKLVKDFVSEDDKPVLKSLKEIRYHKLSDGNVKYII